MCGNGILEEGEACDDGNLVDADGCEADCTLPACGNGIVDPQEFCHDVLVVQPAGTDPSRLDVGDLDGDGTPDVIVVAPSDNEMHRLLVDPQTAQIADATSFVAGLGPARVALGDADGDFDLDAFVLDVGTNEVVLKRNSGTGEFGANEVVAIGDEAITFVVDQVDLDGRLDMVYADTITIVVPPNPPWTGPALKIFLGDGMGGFDPPVLQTTDGLVFDIRVAKVDGDSLPDFVVLTKAPSLLRVYAGSKVGSVDPAGSSALPGPPTGFDLDDVDDDEVLDVAVTVQGDTDLHILVGDGMAGFAGSDTVPVNAEGTAARFARLDDDQDTDLAVATEAGEVHLLRRVGAGTFITKRIVTLSAAASDLARADFNGDGIDDLVAAVPTAGTVEFLLSNP
ncbi:MAG: hypothetical protein D6705_17385 [Deltaproteobacteria bacterium]|nr:MAG: hypothetical protein D6705_17385 [Deltaproteobacteria bacterium]